MEAVEENIGLTDGEKPTPLTYEFWMPSLLSTVDRERLLSRLREICADDIHLTETDKSVAGRFGTLYNLTISPPFKMSPDNITMQVVLLFSKEYHK